MRFLLALLLAVSGAFPLAVAPAAARDGEIVARVDCTSDPETVTVTNATDEAVTVISISSPYPYGNPRTVAVNQDLGPGVTVTYRLGPGASPRDPSRIAGRTIFEDSAPRHEAAVITTIPGTLRAACPNGTDVLPVDLPFERFVGTAPAPDPLITDATPAVGWGYVTGIVNAVTYDLWIDGAVYRVYLLGGGSRIAPADLAGNWLYVLPDPDPGQPAGADRGLRQVWLLLPEGGWAYAGTGRAILN